MKLLIIQIRCPRTLSHGLYPNTRNMNFRISFCLNRNGDVLRKSFTLTPDNPAGTATRHAEFVTGSGDGKHVLKAEIPGGQVFLEPESKSRFNH
jgi:hypothetical protein